MSKFIFAAKVLSDLVLNLEGFFQIETKEINLGVDETVGLIFMVGLHTSVLGKRRLTDGDFHLAHGWRFPPFLQGK